MSFVVRRRVTSTVTYVLLGLFSIYCLFPVAWMVSTAIKPASQVRTDHPSFFTGHPTLINFLTVLEHTQYLMYARNSLIVSAFTTLLSLTISVFAAYAIVRLSQAPGVRQLGSLLLVSQATPPVLLVIPIFFIMSDLNLLNTYFGLIITYTALGVPVCTWFLRSYLSNIPEDIEEAARIDGCSRVSLVFRVILPISLPSVVATGVYAFVLAWGSFTFGYTLVSSNAMRLVTPALSLFTGLWTVEWGLLMAAAVLNVIPVAILYIVVQKYIVGGLVAGAIK